MKIVELAKTIGRLKKTKRTGWIKMKISEPESIADHIMRVSVLAMVAGNSLGVDRDKLVKMALVHDLGESIAGDIVYERAGRDTGVSEEKFAQEKGAFRKLFQDLEEGDEFIGLWEEFERQESREARILRELDKFEMVLQALEYEQEEGVILEEFWETARKRIKHSLIKEWLRKLERQRPKK